MMGPDQFQPVSSRERIVQDFPVLNKLKGVIENNTSHDHDDVFEHTMAVAGKVDEGLDFRFVTDAGQRDRLVSYFSQPVSESTRGKVAVLATFLHDISKPETFVTGENNTTSCPNHEALGAEKAEVLLNEKGYSKDIVSRTKKIITYHGVPHGIINYSKTEQQIEEELAVFKREHGDIFLDVLLHGMADVQGSQLDKLNPADFFFRMRQYQKVFLTAEVPSE